MSNVVMHNCNMFRRALAPAALALGMLSCSQPAPVSLDSAESAINAESLLGEIKTLSSDEYEGRKPGTPGEQKTIAYMQQQFQQMGLKPGNPNGTYLQNVPLAGVFRNRRWISRSGARSCRSNLKDYIAVSSRYAPEVNIKDSGIVFVGYGVVAPEYGWDDYKDVDVKGKTILMLINDPQIPDPAGPLEARRQNVQRPRHDLLRPLDLQIRNRFSKRRRGGHDHPRDRPRRLSLRSRRRQLGRRELQRTAAGQQHESRAGGRLDHFRQSRRTVPYVRPRPRAAQEAGIQKDFKPVTLAGATASFHIANTLRKIDSHNVVAKLEGSDPKLKDQYVIYTAHWDHLGRDPDLKGDQIYNGAADNASGSAGLLEIARAYTKLSPAPKRSILFLSVTAEEQGLLGTEYYAENPLYPLKKTLADINMDVLNRGAKRRTSRSSGSATQRSTTPPPRFSKPTGARSCLTVRPEKGYFYRSDHFEFAKQGVPALDPDPGEDYIGKPAGYGKEKRDYYTEHDYHKPSDEVKPDWDLSGAVDDLRVLFEIGDKVSQTEQYPEWKPGTEFKAKRDQMMK